MAFSRKVSTSAKTGLRIGCGMSDVLRCRLLRILSRLELIDVILHLSSRAFRHLSSTTEEMREGLGYDYLVSGTYRTTGDTIALEMDFHDAPAEVLSWSSEAKIDQAAFLAGEPGALADLAGEIANAAVVSSVRQGAIRPMPDLATHKLLMSAIGLMFNMGDADFGRAVRQLAEVAQRAASRPALRLGRAMAPSAGVSGAESGHRKGSLEGRRRCGPRPRSGPSLRLFAGHGRQCAHGPL